MCKAAEHNRGEKKTSEFHSTKITAQGKIAELRNLSIHSLGRQREWAVWRESVWELNRTPRRTVLHFWKCAARCTLPT